MKGADKASASTAKGADKPSTSAGADAFNQQREALRSAAPTSRRRSVSPSPPPCERQSASVVTPLPSKPPPLKDPLPPIPNRVEDAVLLLAPKAQPFTLGHGFDRDVLAVAYHYGLADDTISAFAETGIKQLRHFRMMADDEDMLKAMVDALTAPLQKRLLKPFLHRLNQADPLDPLLRSSSVSGATLAPSTASTSRRREPANVASSKPTVSSTPSTSLSAGTSSAPSGLVDPSGSAGSSSSSSDKRRREASPADSPRKKSRVSEEEIESSEDFTSGSDRDAPAETSHRRESGDACLARSLASYGSNVSFFFVLLCIAKVVCERCLSFVRSRGGKSFPSLLVLWRRVMFGKDDTFDFLAGDQEAAEASSGRLSRAHGGGRLGGL